MFETSKDILNLLLGVSVFMLALWLSWIFYQIGKTLQSVNKMMSGFNKAADAFTELINKIKEKTNSAGAYLSVLLKGGQQIMEMIKNKKATKNSRKKTDSKK
ncbi:hypothetical protein H6761_02230 [Candidatus Nomurabacteria bacterium]|nr:hypothetical protein [Candidatus Nomurabacteria bacterium]